MSVAIGVIAEDRSDVAVLKHLMGMICKKKFSIQKYVGEGCGNVRKKCLAWANLLHKSGCRHLILVHDLDARDYNALLAELKNKMAPCTLKSRAIIIPVQEIEAWLLSDHDAVNKTFSLNEKMKKISNPETISSPKEHLGKVVWKNSNKKIKYINTVHNAKIAEKLGLNNLRRCKSFVPFEAFIAKI